MLERGAPGAHWEACYNRCPAHVGGWRANAAPLAFPQGSTSRESEAADPFGAYCSQPRASEMSIRFMLLDHEHERFYSRLATLPGIELVPSVGQWVLLKVDEPEDFAKRLNRRLYAGAVSVPKHLEGALRIPVRDAKQNDEILAAVSALLLSRESEAEEDEEQGP